ncbi:DUF2804 domain-containing protein [Alginatibacterium sediminis]|uniref:DUF2804 domain-containing protein n=1 Tax=Alginatibacterium sediminis TaxID=2164068 RepID=A0A420EGM2_9ALTE|nr:DUF2804 domain-containing protein [Alginatibacterium sediminis]RKF19810.1 DUF2804 domain-containing protein [Alginatibacterium sediminis]
MFNTLPAPESLINVDGQPIFGQFDGIPLKLGLEHFRYTTDMDKKASRWAKYFHYKQFQFASIVTPNYVIGLAIADIRYVTSAFCYVYDIHNDKLSEVSWIKALGIASTITSSPSDGITTLNGEPIKFDIQQQQWQVVINSSSIHAELSFTPTLESLPLSMCTPTGYSGWTYTQKHNALAVTGQLSIDGETISLEHALASYDFSAGYMRRETSWRWASINTVVGQAKLGLNLAAGVNETGSCENALWIDGTRHLLGPVHFDFDRSDQHKRWRIYSLDGHVDLSFSAINKRSEKLNLWILKSNFRQFIGHFNGTIIDSSGKRHTLENCLGLTEDHFARW